MITKTPDLSNWEIVNSVAGPIFTNKNIKGYMGQQYPYSTRWEQNIVAIIHIYWGRVISLLLCDHQETESESYEMEIGVAEKY